MSASGVTAPYIMMTYSPCDHNRLSNVDNMTRRARRLDGARRPDDNDSVTDHYDRYDANVNRFM